MERIRDLIVPYLNEELIQAVLSGKKNRKNAGTSDYLEESAGAGAREQADRVKVRPVLTKKGLSFQAEELISVASGKGQKAFHRNLTAEEAAVYVEASMEQGFTQCQMTGNGWQASLLRSQKGHVTLSKKETAKTKKPELSHNREKQYILKEGTPIPYLVELGVMTKDGALVKAKSNKFRQLNRYLEFVRDVLPELPKDRELTILDFGCGKSYLTFALYDYLHCQLGYAVNMIGLDLKEDVILQCNRLAEKFGYEKLRFLLGDIAGYKELSQVDMVVTLHACDTATDYALAKAVAWNARVILSVPCCQHELNAQIKSELLSPVLRYGLLKERMSALLTDGLRAAQLEEQGYEVQLLEFIDLEHTPKNILIRAVKKSGKMRANGRRESERLRALKEEINGELTLERLLKENREEKDKL